MIRRGQPQRVLVTGGSGLLGSNLVLHFSAAKDVWATYLTHPINPSGATAVCVDLTDSSAVGALFDRVRPDIVIHCAAMTNVDDCEDHPDTAMRANALASAIVAQTAASISSRVVQISTDSVFDGMRGDYSESDEPHPLNVYARTKLEAENLVLKHAPDALVVRTNIYGWNALPKQSLAEWMLGSLELGRTVTGFDDVFFSPLLVNDLASLLDALIRAGACGLMHVAGGERISKYDFAVQLAATFGLHSSLVSPASVDSVGLRAPRARDTSLDCSKARAIGLKLPCVSDGLRHFALLRAMGHLDKLRSLAEEVHI
ncbi:MAG: SDR family oxidoreductase [Armatimonadetes bacterium]|nr:SDR family oxidoreductase [Armatimonadota bacterium]